MGFSCAGKGKAAEKLLHKCWLWSGKKMLVYDNPQMSYWREAELWGLSLWDFETARWGLQGATGTGVTSFPCLSIWSFTWRLRLDLDLKLVVLKNRKGRNKSHFCDSDFGKPCSFLCVFPVLTERSLGEQVQMWKLGCLLCSEALLPVSHKGLQKLPVCLCIGFYKTSREVELLLSAWLHEAESTAAFGGWRQDLLLLFAQLLFLTQGSRAVGSEWGLCQLCSNKAALSPALFLFLLMWELEGLWCDFSGAGLHLQVCLLE